MACLVIPPDRVGLSCWPRKRSRQNRSNLVLPETFQRQPSLQYPPVQSIIRA